MYSSIYRQRNRPTQPKAPPLLQVFQPGSLVRVSNLESEPSKMDYNRRNKWLVFNLIGRVLESTSTEVHLLNLRTGRTRVVSHLERLTVYQITQERALMDTSLVHQEHFGAGSSIVSPPPA